MNAMHRLRRTLHDRLHDKFDHERFERGPAERDRPGDDFAEFRRPHGRRGRMFDAGDMKLLVLHILATEPCHGYEIIRVIGEMVGNDYSPSPGTIYPTLALLEDMGLVAAQAQDNGRKQYRITEQGLAHLQEQKAALQAVLERLDHGRKHRRKRGAPEIERAFENLKTALRIRFADGTPDEETLQRIAEIIDQAAFSVGRTK